MTSVLFIIFLVLTPVLLLAGEVVDVSFSVHAIQLQDIVRSRLSSKAEWALIAADVDTGVRLISAGSNTGGNASLVPGSLLKLFVTAAVLDMNDHEPIDLGTVVALNGKIVKGTLHGDVIIKGVGNPFLSSKDLFVGAEKLKAIGVKDITGSIIVDDSLFDTNGWKGRYAGPAYGEPSALGLDLHTVSITAEGSKQRCAIGPPNDSVKVSYNPSGKRGIRRIDDLTYEVMGSLPDAPTTHSRFSLKEPALYAGGTFLTLLKRQGIKVMGTVKRGVAPSPLPSPLGGEDKGKGQKQLREIARIGLKDISALIRETNQQSLNVAADNLLFLLGAYTYGVPGTREKGIQAVRGFLEGLGVTLSGMVVDDGSGVSDLDRLSAEQMVAFLRAVTKKPWFADFYESLSRPGIDGRLQDFGYRSDRIRVKSGQLREAFCLAGYVDQKDGRRIAFSYMVNGTGLDIPAARTAAVEVLKQLEQ